MCVNILIAIRQLENMHLTEQLILYVLLGSYARHPLAL